MCDSCGLFEAEPGLPFCSTCADLKGVPVGG